MNAALDSALQLTQGASGIASDTGAGAAVAESSGAMDTASVSYHEPIFSQQGW